MSVQRNFINTLGAEDLSTKRISQFATDAGAKPIVGVGGGVERERSLEPEDFLPPTKEKKTPRKRVMKLTVGGGKMKRATKKKGPSHKGGAKPKTAKSTNKTKTGGGKGYIKKSRTKKMASNAF